MNKENNLSNNISEDEVNEYEKLLRKLEGDIRSYIKVSNLHNKFFLLKKQVLFYITKLISYN